MAAAREEDNPYNGLGAGGKFRNKPCRRGQSTPYDRPPTANRNPSIIGGGGDGGAYNGWLRKIVDPAQNPSPFQTSGGLDLNAGGGGSFSLGTGGGDKSARRMVKVCKSSQRRK